MKKEKKNLSNTRSNFLLSIFFFFLSFNIYSTTTIRDPPSKSLIFPSRLFLDKIFSSMTRKINSLVCTTHIYVRIYICLNIYLHNADKRISRPAGYQKYNVEGVNVYLCINKIIFHAVNYLQHTC